jgi:hypothetical protein
MENLPNSSLSSIAPSGAPALSAVAAASIGLPPHPFVGPAAARPSVSPKVPQEISDQIDLLRGWQANLEVHERRQIFLSRLLKIPIILSTSCAGLFVFLQWYATIAVSGAMASLCVLVDSYFASKKTFTRAIYDIRILENRIKIDWDVAMLEYRATDKAAAKLLDSIQAERQKIAAYLKDAEISAEDFDAKQAVKRKRS